LVSPVRVRRLELSTRLRPELEFRDPPPTGSLPARRTPAGPATAWWASDAAETLKLLRSSPDGLSDADAADRLVADGPNRLQPRRGAGLGHELLRQFSEPIVLILLAATALALVLGDHIDAIIIFSIVLGSGLLGFWREHAASVAVARLLEQVQIEVEVRRAGRVISVRPDDLVVGDVVVLNAGDVVPGDCRVVAATALQVDESALTGETYPRHKRVDSSPADAELAERHSALYQGSHVVSGQGEAVAVATGPATQLGQMKAYASPADLRQHAQVRLHHDQRELRKHGEYGRRLSVPPLPAPPPPADPAAQFPL
jgi:Mg2+-importing ATPase